MEEETKNEFELDSILPELGDFGRFQIVVYIISCVIVAITGAISLSYIFTTGQVDYRCRIPECDNINSSYFYSDWLNFTTPKTKGQPATCTRFISTLNRSQSEPICSADSFDQSLVESCTSDFIYRNDELTILNEFNLTCIENEWKLAAVGSVGKIAEMIWLPIAGQLSDRYGRRSILITCLLIGGTMGLLKSFSHNYLMFFILQIFEGMVSTSPYIALFILGMEFVEFLPEDALTWRLVLVVVGKSAMGVSITVIFVYCAELFPTKVRHTLLSVACTVGKLGSMAAPQAPLLTHIYPALPLLVFGGLSLTSGLFILFLPETLNAKLPDTLEDAENIGAKQK